MAIASRKQPAKRAVARSGKAKQPAVPAAPYKRTEREKAAVQLLNDRREATPSWPAMKIETRDGVAYVESKHADQQTAALLQMSAFGVAGSDSFAGLSKALVNIAGQRDGKVDEGRVNELSAMVAEISPTNTLEAMLAVQMAAVHDATMSAALRLHQRQDSTIEAANLYAKMLNNLSRTFALQAETLKKLRSTGEQKVTVEHRHYHLAPGAIAPGSQAVLGDVARGGVETKTEYQPHERDDMLLPECAAMHGAIEADQVPLQGAGRDGLERLPVSRRARRSARRTVQ